MSARRHAAFPGARRTLDATERAVSARPHRRVAGQTRALAVRGDRDRALADVEFRGAVIEGSLKPVAHRAAACYLRVMSGKQAAGAVGAVCAAVVLSGCAAAPVDDRPVVTIVEAAQPSTAVPLAPFLPTASELSTVLRTGPNALMGAPVEGDSDVLLSSVADAQATPVDCVGPAFRLQEIVYDASPVRSVATNTWAGGGFDGPPVTGFFGVVQMASPGAAQEFFASMTDQWRRCNGQTVALQVPGHGADELSRITDVAFGERVISANVLHASGGTESPTGMRAVGLVGDCIVEVELTDPRPAGDALGAVAVADVILDKIAATR